MVLTKREIQILRCIANGDKDIAIAQKCNTSMGTVKNQVHTIMEKIGIHSRSELMFQVLKEYHKGRPCIYKDITCQEGWCTECMIPLDTGEDDKAQIKNTINMLEVSLNRSMSIINELKSSIMWKWETLKHG
jgi:DNA-binding CsgD family transcriptional regulator